MSEATGADVAITFNDRPARAWVPASLSARDLELDAVTARTAERAAGAVLRLSDRLGPTLEPLAQLLLRAEGVASSNIEGLYAPVGEVALAEVDAEATSNTAAWVADNLSVVQACLDHAATPRPLDLATLHAWHERLMRHGDLTPELVGRFRDRQGWIGGYSPQVAAYVPPPAGELERLMADLLGYVNDQADGADDALDAVTRAAVAHAQFETVHPYGDGNGRLGRLVVLWILVRLLAVATPPPVSVLILRDPGGYLSGLHGFRTGSIGPWVRWFAGVVERAAAGSMEWAGQVEALLAGWRAQLADLRADATARWLLELLPVHPVVSADLVAQALGVSDTAARTALNLLRDRGIVADLPVPKTGQGRPRRWWIATDLEALVGSWSV